MVFWILLLLVLARSLGSIVADKGYSRLPFQLMLFGLTLLGQLGGVLIGMALLYAFSGRSALVDGLDLCFGYLSGIAGGMAGAIGSFLIAFHLADNVAPETPDLHLPADATAKFAGAVRHADADRLVSAAVTLHASPAEGDPRVRS